MAVTLAAVRNTCVPVLKDVTVKVGSAGYATVAAQGLMWVGRQVVSLVTTTSQADPSRVVLPTNATNGESSEDYTAKAINVASAAATAVCGVAQAGFELLTNPVGLATVVSAVADTTVERGCDLVEHLSKKQVSKLVREPVKMAAAVGVYYVAGAAVVPAALSYGAYRVAAHYACQFFGVGKAKTA